MLEATITRSDALVRVIPKQLVLSDLCLAVAEVMSPSNGDEWRVDETDFGTEVEYASR